MHESNPIDLDEGSPEQINLGPRWSSEEIQVFFDSKSIFVLCFLQKHVPKLFAKIVLITLTII